MTIILVTRTDSERTELTGAEKVMLSGSGNPSVNATSLSACFRAFFFLELTDSISSRFADTFTATVVYPTANTRVNAELARLVCTAYRMQNTHIWAV